MNNNQNASIKDATDIITNGNLPDIKINNSVVLVLQGKLASSYPWEIIKLQLESFGRKVDLVELSEDGQEPATLSDHFLYNCMKKVMIRVMAQHQQVILVCTAENVISPLIALIPDLISKVVIIDSYPQNLKNVSNNLTDSKTKKSNLNKDKLSPPVLGNGRVIVFQNRNQHRLGQEHITKQTGQKIRLTNQISVTKTRLESYESYHIHPMQNQYIKPAPENSNAMSTSDERHVKFHSNMSTHFNISPEMITAHIIGMTR